MFWKDLVEESDTQRRTVRADPPPFAKRMEPAILFVAWLDIFTEFTVIYQSRALFPGVRN